MMATRKMSLTQAAVAFWTASAARRISLVVARRHHLMDCLFDLSDSDLSILKPIDVGSMPRQAALNQSGVEPPHSIVIQRLQLTDRLLSSS